MDAMDLELLHSYEPLWNHWHVDCQLGEGSFGRVYQISREDFQMKQYCALKMISVPKLHSEIKQLESMGMNQHEIKDYHAGMVREVYKEIELMSKLKGKTNIVSYEDHEIRERPDGLGFDILIRMELLKSLTEVARERELPCSEVIKMGKDLCKALILCQKYHIIHRDIKPDNIFLSPDGDYKLGDFGIAKTVEEYQINLSVKGSYEYMAPEVRKGETYDQRVDVYSLGIVLYTFLNKKQIPFLNHRGQSITYKERQHALESRFSGEDIPFPCDAPKTLGEVVLKAISYKKELRYQTAEEFLCALEKVEEELFLSKKEETLYGGTLDLGKTVVLSSNQWECKTVSLDVKKSCSGKREKRDKNKDKQKQDIKEEWTTKRKKKIGKVWIAVFIMVFLGMELKGEKSLECLKVFQKDTQYTISLGKRETKAFEETIKNPGETKELEETKAPEYTKELEETKAPEYTKELEETKPLEYTKELEETKAPEYTKEPEETKVAEYTKEPEETKAPEYTKEPKETKRPQYTKVPTITEKPVKTAIPQKTETPKREEPNQVSEPVETNNVSYANSITVPSEIVIQKGKNMYLPVECKPVKATYELSSTNNEIAGINGGNIIAKKVGQCKIKIQSGKTTVYCKVTVGK